MALGYCPECKELKEITPGSQIDPRFSARWWKLVVHKHPKFPAICLGSGQRI